MDGFSSAAAVIGVVGVALHSIRNLIEFINKISEAPDAVKDILRDLEAVEAVLTTIKTNFSDRLVPDEVKPLVYNTKVKFALENCGKSCDEFKQTITHWMRHSTETKTAWWDRVRTGYFGEAKIKAFTNQLGVCKATVTMALGAMTFITSCHQIQTTKEFRELMAPVLVLKEKQIKEEEQAVERQLIQVNTQAQQLATTGQVEELPDDEAKQSHAELIAAIKKQVALLGDLKEVCSAAVLQTTYERTRLNIEDVKMKQSRLLVGIFNADANSGKIDLNIKGIDATDSRGVVGIAAGIDMGFLNDK